MLRRPGLAGLLALVAIAFWVGSAAPALADRWKRLAVKDIDLSLGSESIDLSKSKGKYKAIRIYAQRAGIFLENVTIQYSLGRSHDENRGIRLRAGQRSRPINPIRNGRFIDRIDILYRQRKRFRRQPKLVIWGLQAPKDANAVRLTDRLKETVAALKDKTLGGGDPVETDSGTVFFGQTSVDFGADRDTIEVGREIGKFDKIRLKVKNNDIQLNEVKVIYGNGQPDVIAYGENVAAGSRTRWLDLKGDRFIKRIELGYESKPDFRGRARVEVYGQLAVGWLGANGSGKGFNRGWVYLGGQSPLFFSLRKGVGYDKDVVSVGRNKGGFRSIRVNVRNRAITLREMTVIYGDGTVDIIPVKKKISAGESYGPVDLKGDGKRAIQEIQVRYRSRIFDSKAQNQTHAFVEFWARH